jgi:hypothetical protein
MARPAKKATVAAVKRILNICTENRVIVQKGYIKSLAFVERELVVGKEWKTEVEESDWMLCNEVCTWRRKKEGKGGEAGGLCMNGRLVSRSAQHALPLKKRGNTVPECVLGTSLTLHPHRILAGTGYSGSVLCLFRHDQMSVILD